AIFFEHYGARGVRSGDWKLVALAGHPWELYNLAEDRTEMNDLAAEFPERVELLNRLWEQWARRARVVATSKPAAKTLIPERPTGSKAVHFELNSGDVLPAERAPNIAAKPITIRAVVTSKSPNGVIVSHGGIQAGYSLYLVKGKPTLTVRHGGTPRTIAGDTPVPSGRFTITATLDKAGTAVLTINDRPVAKGTFPGPIAILPQDPLEIGRDSLSTVGPYESGNPLEGQIHSVTVDLGQPR
ncbi:MAG TPA: LamG-like jellyroll fold domain-containing protein, partial [Thermoguttaceae bacterium]|nr:LamG-like jellyroll fold domain-containing protein [Thermoguttaceae bacterium]